MTNHPTPAADKSGQPPGGVEDHDPAARLARIGVAGRIDRRSQAEALTERRDRDRAHWLGVDTFTRSPTPPERQVLATVACVRDPAKLTTRVSVRGGLWRRCWPQLAHHHPEKENDRAESD